MPIIDEEHQTIAPQFKKLQSTVVLAQAWKKSHTYIRRHNWYADTLELDSSVVDLQNQLHTWAEALKLPDFTPHALRVVPAPKNGIWEFHSPPVPFTMEAFLDATLDGLGSQPSFADWRSKRTLVPVPALPVEDNQAAPPVPPMWRSLQKLRPLAHLTIRDQTLATAVMMCLADVVESAQGDSSHSVDKALAAGISSYGNRLQCQWTQSTPDRERALFSWGSGKTYRKFYDDYRTFLARPRNVCAQLAPSVQKGFELYVVSLDIKSFFDCIDTQALLRELRVLEKNHREQFGIPDHEAADEEFWQATERIFSWKWHQDDHPLAALINGSTNLELGLPQGLVSSGFFANAYLIKLDQAIVTAALAKEVHGQFKLLDYCRYVDDIRLVIEAPSSFNYGGLEALLTSVKVCFEAHLSAHQLALAANKALSLSPDKCTIVPYRSISVKSNLSATMEALQSELSGTFDLESLIQADGGLESLLQLSEKMASDIESIQSRLALATVALPELDVRDDTLKRFVAARFCKSLRARLSMSESAEGENLAAGTRTQLATAREIAHDFESTARKLIKCWSANPSLGILLRYALDLYPHPRLLTPILEALEVKIFGQNHGSVDELKEVKVAEYLVADLFNAASCETGYRPLSEYPTGIDIDSYREQLSAFAKRILMERVASPWYLQQQASMLLASLKVFAFTPLQAAPSPELIRHHFLHLAMLYQPMSADALLSNLPVALVGQQLAPNSQRFGEWFAHGLKSSDANIQQEAVKVVARARPDLLQQAVGTRGGRASLWKQFVPDVLLLTNKASNRKSSGEGIVMTLHQLIKFSQNAFSQENAILLLAKTLLTTEGIKEHLEAGISAAEIFLRCTDWSLLNALPADGVLEVSHLAAPKVIHEVYQTPSWVAPDKAWLYSLGRILRSAITGDFDFTSNNYLLTDDFGKYQGIRSTSYNRRFSLLNNGKGMLDEPAPVTPWLSGLFSALLQWPGMFAWKNDAAPAGDARTVAELRSFFERRIASQRQLYAVRSKTPVYVIPTAPNSPLERRPMRVAIVQPMLPRRDEFNVKEPTRWSANDLARHEQHLAQVCRLTHQKLRSWESAKRTSPYTSTEKPWVDIILFPELSVHPQHMSYLDALSDATGASIFAGLTFVHSPKLKGTINQGVWLLRTQSVGGGRVIEYVWQGKKHPIKQEVAMGVVGYRPHMTLVEFPIGTDTPTRVAAAICYDSTDLDLLADLREQSDMFLVSALNQDISTFDNMVAALNFHMYQPVILANSGEFGGSTAQVPLPKHEKLIAHVHGGNQVAVSVFEVDPSLFKTTVPGVKPKELKTAPAGYRGRPGVK